MKRSSIALIVVVAVILVMLPTAHYRIREEPIFREKVVTWEEIRSEAESHIQEFIQEAKIKGFEANMAIVRYGEPTITQFRTFEVVGYRTIEYVVWLPWWMP